MDAMDNNGKNDTYYGYFEEIWELDYGPNFKVPLFHCQWVKLSGGGVTKDEYGMCNTRFIKEHKPRNHIRARIKSHVYTTE